MTSSAHCFPYERADPCLLGGGQLLQREGGRPHVAFVEVRLVAEAERRVPRLELLRALEEADDIAVLGIRGHPVPGFRPTAKKTAIALTKAGRRRRPITSRAPSSVAGSSRALSVRGVASVLRAI